MNVKVAKFGGSSVADGIQIAKIKAISLLRGQGNQVCSSFRSREEISEDSKITDLLYSCKTHIEHNLPYEQLFQVVCDRYHAVEFHLGVDVTLKTEFDIIRKNLEEGTTSDYIASRGEYLNAKLIGGIFGLRIHRCCGNDLV